MPYGYPSSEGGWPAGGWSDGGNVIGGMLGSVGGFLGGPVGGIIGNVVGGLLGGDDDDAEEAYEKEAQKQRDWQQFMSRTAHQREVNDLRAAGLNPILSATRGTSGATSAPSGAQPAMHQTEQIRVAKFQAGIQAATAAAQIQNVKANTALQMAQAEKTEKETITEAERPNAVKAQAYLHDISANLHGQQRISEETRGQVLQIERDLSKNRLEFFQVEELKKLQTDVNILREKLKQETRAGNLMASEYGEIMMKIKLFFDALPIRPR